MKKKKSDLKDQLILFKKLGCPVCEERKQKNAEYQAKFRQKQKRRKK